MISSALKDWLNQVEQHLYDFYLPFWCGPALDHENGGWMGWLANDLTPDRTQPKGLIVNARILWAFSAAHQARENSLFIEMAKRAFNFLTEKFLDHSLGGAFWRLDDQGKVLDDSKKIYGQAFCIYAFTEYYRATGHQSALNHAQALFQLVERHAHDANYGGYTEVCNRDWSVAGPEARLSAKDMNEKKSMNNHLHVLEAYTNLYRVWPDGLVADRLRELIELFLEKILDPQSRHLHHFFNEQWQVRSDSYTYGHDIEASWLLCEAAEILKDAALLQRVQSAAVQMAGPAFTEGLSADGGLNYEGKNGAIIDAGKECWPQAEAMVGFLNTFEMTRDEKFITAAWRVWNFTQSHLVDSVHGEWFWRINPDGKPDSNLPKISEWKGPYHVTRACLESARRLKTILYSTHNPIAS